MADLDLNKISKEIGEILTNFFNNFISLLTNPKDTIKNFLFVSQQTIDPKKEKENENLRRAFIYSLISIAIGLFLGSFLKLSGTPDAQNIGTLVAVLFIWILTAIIIHPLLKLFKGKGKIKETIIVFLLITSTLHLIWIPIVSLISNLLVQTRVYLTYNYVISFSSSGYSKYERYEQIIPVYVESYIKGKEPKKEGTILPPVDTTGINNDDSLLYNSKFSLSRTRIIPDSTSIELPKKEEQVELKTGAYNWISLISILYYLSNSYYLALGMSIPHAISSKKLFVLATLGPMLIILSVLILIIMALVFTNI